MALARHRANVAANCDICRRSLRLNGSQVYPGQWRLAVIEFEFD